MPRLHKHFLLLGSKGPTLVHCLHKQAAPSSIPDSRFSLTDSEKKPQLVHNNCQPGGCAERQAEGLNVRGAAAQRGGQAQARGPLLLAGRAAPGART